MKKFIFSLLFLLTPLSSFALSGSAYPTYFDSVAEANFTIDISPESSPDIQWNLFFPDINMPAQNSGNTTNFYMQLSEEGATDLGIYYLIYSNDVSVCAVNGTLEECLASNDFIFYTKIYVGTDPNQMNIAGAYKAIDDYSSDLGDLIFFGIVIILGIAVALIGIGYAWNKIKKHTVGNGMLPSEDKKPDWRTMSETDIINSKRL